MFVSTREGVDKIEEVILRVVEESNRALRKAGLPETTLIARREEERIIRRGWLDARSSSSPVSGAGPL